MKINFTKKQFRTLIDLIFAGELVINGHRTPDEIDEEFHDLQQYIYSFAKQMGYEDLIKYSKEYNEYHETRKYDESRIHDDMSTLSWTVLFRTIYLNPYEFICNCNIAPLFLSRVNALATLALD